MNADITTSTSEIGNSAVVLPLRHDREKFADWGWIRDATGEIVYQAKLPCCPNSIEADEHRRNKTDPTQGRVDALLKAFQIVQRLAEWSRKYPRQQIHSFSAKVDEQLIAIEEEAKALLDGQTTP